MSEWKSLYTWPELVDCLDFHTDFRGVGATHTFPRRTAAARGLWDDEKDAVGKIWGSQDGGARWHLLHEAPGRIVVIQCLVDQTLAVRQVYTNDRNPPLKHQLELLPSGGGQPRILGVLPELAVGVGFISLERGYVWAAKNIYWTETAGRVWSKVAQRTPDSVVATIQSIQSDGAIYYIRDHRVFRHQAESNLADSMLDGMANALAQTVCVDRDAGTVVVAAKDHRQWLCGFYKGRQLQAVETIDGAPFEETRTVMMHAASGTVTLITISTKGFLPEYASFRRNAGRWRREEISGARNFGALAFSGEHAWVARRSASEPATRLYQR